MDMKKATIVTAFLNYDYRTRIVYLEKFLVSKGFDVEIITSNYDHRNKREYFSSRNNVTILNVPFYKKNFSLRRILSHLSFSRSVRKYLERSESDFVYVITPPNFLFKYMGKYKIAHKDVKVIFEIEDLWPESMPISVTIKKLCHFPFIIWRKLRDNNICKADGIVYECELFRNILGKSNYNTVNEVLYLTKDDVWDESYHRNFAEDGTVNLLYLGSINNLIDVDLIVDTLIYFNKKRKTCLQIIGQGEKSLELMEKCKQGGIRYINHGSIYNDEDKKKVISKCDYALNIMKDTVCVGATMKSLEYLHYGLPIINNIKGDTKKIVIDYKCGINISKVDYEHEIDKLLSVDDDEYEKMRNAARCVYSEFFSPQSYYSKMNDFYLKIIGKE